MDFLSGPALPPSTLFGADFGQLPDNQSLVQATGYRLPTAANPVVRVRVEAATTTDRGNRSDEGAWQAGSVKRGMEASCQPGHEGSLRSWPVLHDPSCPWDWARLDWNRGGSPDAGDRERRGQRPRVTGRTASR